jgi:predicted transcriptional regulator
MDAATKAKMVTCALISTVAETGPAPLGVLYAGVMGDFNYDQFMGVMSKMEEVGFITRNGDVVTITQEGRKTASKIDAAFEKAGVRQP